MYQVPYVAIRYILGRSTKFKVQSYLQSGSGFSNCPQNVHSHCTCKIPMYM